MTVPLDGLRLITHHPATVLQHIYFIRHLEVASFVATDICKQKGRHQREAQLVDSCSFVLCLPLPMGVIVRALPQTLDAGGIHKEAISGFIGIEVVDNASCPKSCPNE